MSKFFENIKSGINEKKTNHKFSKSLKRLKTMELASANSAGAGAFGQMAKQTQTAGKINTGSLVLEGFNLFRKK